MTRRERLRRCYEHQETDRPGVYVRTNYPSNDPSYDRLKSYLAAHSERKLVWDLETVLPPFDENWSTEPFDEDWEMLVHEIRTPAGPLRSESLVSLKGRPGLARKHFLHDRADAEKLLSLPPRAPRGDCEGFAALDREVGDAGIAEVYIGSNPAGWAAELFGSECFAMLSITDRDILHALCRRRRDEILTAVRYALANGAGPYFAMAGEEFLVPPLHGPADFADFNVRYDKPIIDLLHDAGARMHIHSHGSIAKVIDQFVAMGTDVLHPFEAPPLGDISAVQAKAACRGRTCLEGNIQIADMYEQTPQQLREQILQLIDDCFDDRRGLIVCPTASAYYRGCGETAFENFRTFVETVVNWKG